MLQQGHVGKVSLGYGYYWQVTWETRTDRKNCLKGWTVRMMIEGPEYVEKLVKRGTTQESHHRSEDSAVKRRVEVTGNRQKTKRG